MIAAMFRGLGQFALLLVSMALLVVMSLFVIGSFLLTWPLHRLSPRDRRLRASVGFASSGMTLLTAYSDGSIRKMMENATEDEPEDYEPDPAYPYEDGDTLVLGPECFVASDGSVLNWRGQNFLPAVVKLDPDSDVWLPPVNRPGDYEEKS